MKQNLFIQVLATIFLTLLNVSSFAQKHKPGQLSFPDVTVKDFEPTIYALDSSADAVFLIDAGTAWLTGNDKGGFNVHFKTVERIRLLNNKSFDNLATVNIPLLVISSDYKEDIKNFEAFTYNIEGDKIISTPVEKSSIFKEKNGQYENNKFTFPELKPGSIIEYKYETEKPFEGYFPSWNFQGHYPRLWSEFITEIPALFDFIGLYQGFQKAFIDTVTSTYQNFSIAFQHNFTSNDYVSVGSDVIKHKWAYKDVPPLKEEPFITTLDNYRQNIEFQFSALRYKDQPPYYYMNGWDEMVKKLNKDEDFGGQFALDNLWISDEIEIAAGREKEHFARAKKIYEYLRDNYTCTDYSAIYLTQSLKQTAKQKKGNVSDINMLLIAMLRHEDFKAIPILLSTRDHGKTYDKYPIMNKFNYVIVKTEIDGKEYLLDASTPLLGFGKIDNDCYNGNARMVDYPPLILQLSADSLTEGRITTVFMSNNEDASISGHISTTLGDMASLAMRRKMKKTNPDEYFKDLKKGFNFDATITNTSIDSLTLLDEPVAINYDLSFKPDEDILYFNPMLGEAITENPFAAAERIYPVEMPYKVDKTYIFNMEVPKGYMVDELPKPTRVSFNENEGMFEYLIAADQQRIQLRCSFKLNKANFLPEDYESLRELYSFITEKEGEQIVFKKQ